MSRPSVLIHAAAAFAFLTLGSTALAGGFEARVPSGGARVALELPAAWIAEIRPNPIGLHLSIRVASSDPHERVLVSVVQLPPERSDLDAERARDMARRGGEELLPTALQERIEVERLPLAEGALFYYHLTDREPERGPGDFREMRQGVGFVRGHMVTVTVLTHSDEEALVESALRALSTLSIGD